LTYNFINYHSRQGIVKLEELENKTVFTADASDSGFDFAWNLLRTLPALGFLEWLAIKELDGFERLFFILLIAVIWWVLISLFWGNTEVYIASIDRRRQFLTITEKWQLTFWVPKTRNFPVKNIKEIVLGNYFETEKRLMINFKSGYQAIFTGSAGIKDGEKISTALQIPLQIDLSGERITYIPWDIQSISSLTPTPCTKCGAPLGKILPDMKNIKCDHCGITMIIEWRGQKLSYKPRNDEHFL
jgi:DNA-directed RNA polymerase subunit RPC12/RpoP